jgi:hypothetical protein
VSHDGAVAPSAGIAGPANGILVKSGMRLIGPSVS